MSTVVRILSIVDLLSGREFASSLYMVYALLIPAFILARFPRRSRCSGAAASTLRFPTMQ